MYDYSTMPRHDILCIDMKSFYASCECVMRGLDPLTTKLAVVGDINRNGSVVLASSPELKKLGIKTGSRLFEVKNLIRESHDNSIIIAQARMKKYLSISKEIRKIFEMFVPPNQIHTYSVDESWLTLDGTSHLWGTPKETAEKIIEKIKNDIGVMAAIGIGDNKFLAKAVLDIHAKKEGISECRFEDVKEKLHPVPIQKMWGCGTQMTKHFNSMGIYTIGDLANSNLKTIKNRFGKNGEILYQFSWGIDPSPVFYNENSPPQSAFAFSHDDINPNAPIKSVGRGVTLLKDYVELENIKLAIKEIIDEVCEELRKRQKIGRTIHLSIGYSKNSLGQSFSRQKTIKHPTNDSLEINKVCLEIFEKFHSPKQAVRQIRVSVSNLDEEEKISMEDFTEEKIKRKKISTTTDIINERFGKGTILNASSYTDFGIGRSRSKKVGGHFE